MTAQNKTTIKSYFEAGDKPTVAQFANLVDSYQDTSNALVSVNQVVSAASTEALLAVNGSQGVFTPSAVSALSIIGGVGLSVVAAKGDVIAGTASATVARLQVGSNGQLLTPSSSTSTGLLWSDRNDGFRNRIINGDMSIDQRYVGAAISVATVTPLYTLDRYAAVGQAAAGVFSIQRLSSGTPPSGFSHYLRIKTTTADASPAAGAYYYLAQSIEGLNVVDFALGSSGAVTFTMSMRLRSSITGTFSGVFNNNGSNRTYPWTCTISSANTWTPITVTVAGDQAGTWLTDTSCGLRVCFDIGCGSTFRGAEGSWITSQVYGVTSSTRLISTLNATLDIAGLQLEAGSVATAFERRSYGEKLAACQRYYRKSLPQEFAPAQNTTIQTGAWTLYTSTGVTGTLGGTFGFATMRTAPTITTYNPLAANSNWRDTTNSVDRTVSLGAIADSSITGIASGTVAAATHMIHFTADAEI